MRSEPAIVLALIAAALVAAGFAITGAFADGVQAQEWTAIVGPVLAAIGIRREVYSPEAHDRELAVARRARK